MTAPAHTSAALARVLVDAGFEVADKPAGSALIGGAPSDWWDLADADLAVVARVLVTAEDGFEMFAFTGGRAMLLQWQARFSGGTPTLVLREAIAALAGHALAEQMLATTRRDPSVVHADLPVGPGGRGY